MKVGIVVPYSWSYCSREFERARLLCLSQQGIADVRLGGGE